MVKLVVHVRLRHAPHGLASVIYGLGLSYGAQLNLLFYPGSATYP